MVGGSVNGEKKEPPIETWKRFNEAAAEEKRWMSNRLTWVFTPQTILIGAYVLVLRFGNGSREGASGEACSEISQLCDLALVILLVGLATSILGFLGLFAAGRMHWKWTTRLNCLAEEIDRDVRSGDYRKSARVPFGSCPHWPARSSSIIPPLMALIFVLAWGYILCRFISI